MSTLADANSPGCVRPGAMLLAGNSQSTADVLAAAVDNDGQGHSGILPGSVANNLHLLKHIGAEGPARKLRARRQRLERRATRLWCSAGMVTIGLITRRSQVQILPPPPSKMQVRPHFSEWGFLFPRRFVRVFGARSSRNSRGSVSHGYRSRPELLALHKLKLDALT